MNEKLEKLAEVIKDENLAKELFSLTQPEDAQKWISDHGVEMTVEEVKELGAAIRKLITEKSPEEIEKLANGEDMELTDEQLAEAAGGFLSAAVGIVVGVAKVAAVTAAGAVVCGTISGVASWLFGGEEGVGW